MLSLCFLTVNVAHVSHVLAGLFTILALPETRTTWALEMHGTGERQRDGKTQEKEYVACIFLFLSFYLLSLCTRAVSGPVAESDSDLLRDEEEGEDSLLCDPEEMDLLGEIFDTLSTRSSHERGLLYGTRSLDLFGPDSHDYITKVRK